MSIVLSAVLIYVHIDCWIYTIGDIELSSQGSLNHSFLKVYDDFPVCQLHCNMKQRSQLVQTVYNTKIYPIGVDDSWNIVMLTVAFSSLLSTILLLCKCLIGIDLTTSSFPLSVEGMESLRQDSSGNESPTESNRNRSVPTSNFIARLEELSECDEFLSHIMQRDSCTMIKEYETQRNSVERSVDQIMF